MTAVQAPSSGITVRAFTLADEAAVAALWDRVLPDARPWSTGAAVIARKWDPLESTCRHASLSIL